MSTGSALPSGAMPELILTPRLKIRPIEPDDGKIVYAAKQESWAEFEPWWIWTHKTKEQTKVADDAHFCSMKHGQYVQGKHLCHLAFDRETDKLIGQVSINNCDWKNLTFDLGFWVRTSEVGKGYAREMSIALAHYAFGALNARKLRSLHAEANKASQRVLQKVGFVQEGILRQQHQLSHGYVDEVHYGLLKTDPLPALDVQWS